MNTWVNGVLSDRVDHRDRGLQYGDGLFETMRVTDGAIRLLDFHLERLAAGCERLKIVVPNLPRLRKELKGHAAPRSQAVLKLIVTRGVGTRGYRPSGRERSTRVICLYALSRKVLQSTEGLVRIRMHSQVFEDGGRQLATRH